MAFDLLVNVPVGITAIALTQAFVPESRAATPRRVDPPGQILMAAFIGALSAAIIEGQSRGWGSPLIVVLFAGALASALGLGMVERRRREPLLDLRFFRSAPFSGATVVAVAAFAALAGFLFVNTLYLQDVRHENALDAGLLTLPMAAVLALVAPRSGHLVAARGARLPLVLAGVGLTLGPLLLITLGPHTPVGLLVLAYLVFGFGMGMVNAPISNAAVSGMPRSRSGVAAAIASTGRQFGGALGVAITGSLLAGTTDASFTGSSHLAWGFLAGLGVLVLLAGLLSTGRWARRTAEQVAELITTEDSP